ncbi:MAG: GDSL-type esterase/lipase family protein [Bacteroidetes bacterium]|nr:GDSL-type esterase/lipase family protein [Bacteroidota bacterium]
MLNKTSLVIAFCLTGWSVLHAQNNAGMNSLVPVAETGMNRFIFPRNSGKTYEKLFQRLNDLVMRGEGTVNIVQIGDSHIQAGFIPEEMRKNFTAYVSSGCGARGLIFPYRIAKTNNPADYVVKFTGKWVSCRNVELKKTCSLGLTGIATETRDTLATMIFRFKNNAVFRQFNRVRIFHDPTDTTVCFDFPDLEGRYMVNPQPHKGYTDVDFDFILDSLRIRIVKEDTTGSSFRLYGIDFENGDPGIVYSAAGVNGAEVTSFLRCDQLESQLRLMHPDWIIISLGTNDAYPLHFDKEQFVSNYKSLINSIRKVDPGLPVLLTVPGDSYRKRRYDNLNMIAAREGIFEVAKETGCAVWDFYTIMGGTKSIMKWYKAGLVARDKLHFDKQGYIIQGDLLFDAFMDAWESYIDSHKE